jgi:nitrogen fixation NifU-like protein
MGATSILMQKVHGEGLSLDEVLALDYEAFMDEVGRDAIGSRARNATMGLSAVKAAVRKYRKDNVFAGVEARRTVA